MNSYNCYCHIYYGFHGNRENEVFLTKISIQLDSLSRIHNTLNANNIILVQIYKNHD